MRIAVVGQSCFPNRAGGERLVDFFAANLQARGDHVRVFVPDTLPAGTKFINRIPFRPPPAPYEIELLRTNLPTEGPLSPYMTTDEMARGADCPGLESALLGFAPDVVIAVAAVVFHVSHSVLIAQNHGIPSVLLGAPHFDEDWVKWPSVRKAGTLATVYCALSDIEKEQVNRVWRKDGQATVVVHPCHFRSTWETAKPEPRMNPANLLYFGRLARKKKLEYLIREVILFAGSKRNKASLVLAGTAHEDFRDELSDLARAATTSGVPVKIRENVSEADKLDLFMDSDWVLMPNPDESFGLAHLEAFAGGGRLLLPGTPLYREVYGDRYMQQASFSAGEEGSLAARLRSVEDGAYSDSVRLETMGRLRKTYRLDNFLAEAVAAVELAVSKKSTLISSAIRVQKVES